MTGAVISRIPLLIIIMLRTAKKKTDTADAMPVKNAKFTFFVLSVLFAEQEDGAKLFASFDVYSVFAAPENILSSLPPS